MRTEGTYIIAEPNAYKLAVEYDYYWDDGDYEMPPDSELEVTKVTLNGMDITIFYTDFLENIIEEQVWDYARENK